MKLSWHLLLCLFGRHDPGEWQRYSSGTEEQKCKHCNATVGLRLVLEACTVYDPPKDYA